MNVRVCQLDGEMPNLALMNIAHWHRGRGDDVLMTREIEPALWEPRPDRVYGGAIFAFSQDRLMRFMRQWPDAIVGGTGTPFTHTVADVIGTEHTGWDYSGHRDPVDKAKPYQYSIGFTQRGCRLSCKFCVVPKKEGKPRSAFTISDIWRGAPWPKKLHLLDNDFFGQPEDQWRARIAEIRDGAFRVCLSQGINTRLITDEAAAALASIQYRNTTFDQRVLYTAWDNLKDEGQFFRGVDTLERAGIPAKHLRAYMLIGFDKNETWPRLWHRFFRMVDRAIEPYPMVFNRARTDLLCFQRWVITGLYRHVTWDLYERETKSAESVAAYLAHMKGRPA